jgi:glycosyltransferase involved in cell wall biosynthesis
MKIAYDHQIFGWQEYGGISRYFYELANTTACIGAAEVAVVSPFYVSSYLKERSEALRVFGRKMPAIRRSGRFYRAINKHLAPPLMRDYAPDIVHETYYSNCSVATKASKVVVTIHDMVHELFPESFDSWDSTAREKAVAVRRADHVICVSANTKKDLVEILGIDVDSITVVHHGFSLTQRDKNLSGNFSMSVAPYILYVGSRGGYKNFVSLLSSFAANQVLRSNFKLVAFGGGPLTARERNLISELGLPEDSVLQIAGDDALLADLYRAAAVFVYPSLYEGFGIPPLEAMSFDCPVACSNSSSIPEVVGDAALLFDPHSVHAIGAALVEITSSQMLRATLVAKGRERIKLFSWKNCADQTMNVYRQLLG